MEKCPHPLDPSRLSVLEEIRANSFARIKSLSKRIGEIDVQGTDDPDKQAELLAQRADAEAEMEAARAARDQIGELYLNCRKVMEGH